MKRFIHYIVLFFILLIASDAESQTVKDFSYTHLGKRDGMVSQRVWSICQAADGALWWSTKKGIDRYNGVVVKNYSLGAATSYSSLAGRTTHLKLTDGDLYAFDNKGKIYIYSPIYDCFDLKVDLSRLMDGDVMLNDILVTKNGIYLAMYQGIYLLKDNKLKPLRNELWANCIIKTNKGILFGTHRALVDEKMNELLQGGVESGYYDAKYNKVWLGGFDNGLTVLTLDNTGKVSRNDFVTIGNKAQQNPIRCFYPYNYNLMLIGIDGLGVYTLSRNDASQSPSLLFDANEGPHGVLHGNGVYSVFLDSWNNIVVGSYSGGIDIARPIGKAVTLFEHISNNPQTVTNDRVNSVAQIGENVFFGTDNGISILNVASGNWQHICPGVVVIDLFKTRDNRVLASTFGKGVYEISAQGSARPLYSTEQGTLRDDHVYASFIDKENNLWMGCLEGDLVLKNASGTQYFAVKNVMCITQLPSGDVAVGTADGIKLVNSGSASVSELTYSSGNDVNRYVASMLVNNGELWIGTDGGGVYIYDLAKKTTTQLTTEQGLPSNCVSSLIRGADGRIWIGTDQGLAFVAAAHKKVVNVNYCYGIDREYSYGAALLMQDGKILFGTTTGAVMIDPSSVTGLDYTTKLRITGVSCEGCDNERQFKECVHKMLATGKLTLSYDQSTFDLYYESINLRNQYDIAYQYQVGDGEWSQLTDQQYIRFTNLEPGTHRLRLRCVSLTSHAVIDETELTIDISEPWWNSWWMWCIYALLLSAALYGAWRIYKLHDKYMRLTIDYLRLKETPSDSKSSTIMSPAAQESTPVEKPASHEGNDFVDRATQHIVDNMSDPSFNIDKLCHEMAMSRTLFYVKLKSYTGKSPQDFMRVIRMERAAILLRNGHPVTETAQMTGFDNPKYFSTVFKKYFGTSPSKFQ